ncbi:MAG TPA: VC0807 family protein [Acidimicrobiales bacterium]|nr:VC0807 family protein [Acidimicrobiales bacterium]
MSGQAATIDTGRASEDSWGYRETDVATAVVLDPPAETTTSTIWHKMVRLIVGALPAMTIATVIPLCLFYGVSAVAGLQGGIVASLAWAYLMLGRQIIRSRRMSGLLTITAFTLTVRCITWVVHQSAFTFFAVPVFETIGMSLLFVVTLALGRPLLVSLARDFVPSVGDHLAHSDHKKLVRDLSCLWGAVYLGSATSTAVLLRTQDLHLFLLLHQMSGWVWTGSGLLVTFFYARRHAQGLMTIATSGMRVAAA